MIKGDHMADKNDELRAEQLSDELGEDSGEATFECEKCHRVLPNDCMGKTTDDGDLRCEDCEGLPANDYGPCDYCRDGKPLASKGPHHDNACPNWQETHGPIINHG